VAEDFVQHLESVGQSYLDQLQARQNIDTSSVIVQADNPAIALCQIAEEQQVDLILVSAHGTSAHPTHPIGDTAHSLLAHCRQPMLIFQDRPEPHTLEPEAAPLREQDERPIDYSSLSGATIA
jgi:nucleotide-binding universal stress UspA family protein